MEFEHDDDTVEAHICTHIVFSTAGQRDVLPAEGLDGLYADIKETLANLGAVAEGIGGTANHVHIVSSLPMDRSLDEIVARAKSESAKWIRASLPAMRNFCWQESYGAFSLSPEEVEVAVAFARNQPEHHEIVSFQDEFLSLLREHGIPFDESEVWE
jgi:REP element-mobilizing transposase RayT